MPSLLPLLPDSILLARQAWLTVPAVTAIVDTRIYDRIHGAAFPQLVIETVTDGESSDPHMGLCRLQHNCWGRGNTSADTQEARLLARTIVQHHRNLQGSYAAGTVVEAWLELFVPAPDPTTGRARFIVDLVFRTI